MERGVGAGRTTPRHGRHEVRQLKDEQDLLLPADVKGRGEGDPRGQFVATGSRDKDELIVADLDLDQIKETRHTWQFYRDRRPETYQDLAELLP